MEFAKTFGFCASQCIPIQSWGLTQQSKKFHTTTAFSATARSTSSDQAVSTALQSPPDLPKISGTIDPGHWNYSQEWWGTQDGGWGLSPGDVIFSKTSQYNGLVEVTSHHASSINKTLEKHDEKKQEWRVLRFNSHARQSVSRVSVNFDDDAATSTSDDATTIRKSETVRVHPHCIAQEYLKSCASVLSALFALQRLYKSNLECSPLRVLCIGIGGGTLPLFLNHHFPTMHIDAVEIDAVVVEAATQAMGLPLDLPNLNIVTQDAVEFLKQRVEKMKREEEEEEENVDDFNSFKSVLLKYDVVYIDAFNGENSIPTAVCSEEFAENVAAVVHPVHGMVLMNFHSTDFIEVAGRFHSQLMMTTIMEDEDENRSSMKGCCFAVSTQKQLNVTVACARGLVLPADPELAKEWMKLGSTFVSHEAGFNFPTGARSKRGYMRLF